MSSSLFLTLGKVAGLAGLAVGLLLVIFRSILAKTFFSKMTSRQTYRLITLIALLAWSTSVIGVGAWLVIKNKTTEPLASAPQPQSVPPAQPPPNVSAVNGLAAGRDIKVQGDVTIDSPQSPTPPRKPAAAPIDPPAPGTAPSAPGVRARGGVATGRDAVIGGNVKVQGHRDTVPGNGE